MGRRLDWLLALTGALLIHAAVVALLWLSSKNWLQFKPPRAAGLSIEAFVVDSSAWTKLPQLNISQPVIERTPPVRQPPPKTEPDPTPEQPVQQAPAKQPEPPVEVPPEPEPQIIAEDPQPQVPERQPDPEPPVEQPGPTAAERLALLREQQQRRTVRINEDDDLDDELRRIREAQANVEDQLEDESQRLRDLAAMQETVAASDTNVVQEPAVEPSTQTSTATSAESGGQGELRGLRAEYVEAIRRVVVDNWTRPHSVQPELSCTVKVRQIPGGEVVAAEIAGVCNGNEAVRRSIVAAVKKARYLPYTGYERVFESELEFEFKHYES